MKKLIAGNWKMNGGLAANEALVSALLSGMGQPASEVVLCTPSPYLAQLQTLLASTPMASGTVRQRGFSRRSAGWPAPGWSCEPDLAVSGWRRQVGHAVRKFHRLDRRLTVARALSCVSSSMTAATVEGRAGRHA